MDSITIDGGWGLAAVAQGESHVKMVNRVIPKVIGAVVCRYNRPRSNFRDQREIRRRGNETWKKAKTTATLACTGVPF